MPAAARAGGTDAVFSLSGTGKNCNGPIMTVTGTGSPNVLINGLPAVRLGDLVGPHPFHGCGPDLSVLTTGSPTVLINGVPAGRIGDIYTSDNIIISGSPTVFIG
jgi:uncharacterized Zn-binding protein involved in type VI secretion